MVHLLKTKLLTPQTRPDAVARPRLHARIAAGARQRGAVTLVCAPAGFGKTTLIAGWLAQPPAPLHAWLSLDQGDNDPVLFLSYVAAALSQAHAEGSRLLSELLQSPQPPPLERALTVLVNALADLHRPFTLVLDDYQLIDSDAVHKAVQFLINHQPPQLHLVLNTREDPPLALAALRAHGRLTELRERDLRFDPDEAGEFLRLTMHLNLSPEVASALTTRTDGWIAGLQLAALALQNDDTTPEEFVNSFAEQDYYVMDYLMTEVLGHLPADQRDFLRRTSVLERLSAPLCDQMTGRTDSQALLEVLTSSNLFITPLDARREWYRYHRLFAEVLRASLGEAERLDLHARALRWHEANDGAEHALPHAFTLARSGDVTHLVRLLLVAMDSAIHAGRIPSARAWLSRAPAATVQGDPELCVLSGWVAVLSADLDAAERYAVLSEARSEAEDEAPSLTGKRCLLRAVIALSRRDDAVAAAHVTSASAFFDALPPHWRITALWMLAEARERAGDVQSAIDALHAAREDSQALESKVFAIAIDASLAVGLNRLGRRREAMLVCEDCLRRQSDGSGKISPAAGILSLLLGYFHYEANALAAAREHLERGIGLCEQLQEPSPIAVGRGFLAMVLRAEGRIDEALRMLAQALFAAQQETLADSSWIGAWEADLRLMIGDVSAASAWRERADHELDGGPHYLHVDSNLTEVRLLVAQRQLSAAQERLAHLARFLEAHRLQRWLISTHILQALCADAMGQRALVHERLRDAVRLAAPEDYRRAFLVEDARVLLLLPEVSGAAPSFVRQLLQDGGFALSGRATTTQPLAERLTERERQVLELIAAGESNAAIAARLVVAESTVKRHINNIYGKLEADSRTHAVAKARAIGLL